MALNRGSKLLIVMIIVAVAGIVLRWSTVSIEVANAFKGLFEK